MHTDFYFFMCLCVVRAACLPACLAWLLPLRDETHHRSIEKENRTESDWILITIKIRISVCNDETINKDKD